VFSCVSDCLSTVIAPLADSPPVPFCVACLVLLVWPTFLVALIFSGSLFLTRQPQRREARSRNVIPVRGTKNQMKYAPELWAFSFLGPLCCDHLCYSHFRWGTFHRRLLRPFSCGSGRTRNRTRLVYSRTGTSFLVPLVSCLLRTLHSLYSLRAGVGGVKS